MVNFRKIIAEELEKQGKTPSWLANRTETPHPNTVYRYLRGELDLTGDRLGTLLAALGLEVRQKNGRKRK